MSGLPSYLTSTHESQCVVAQMHKCPGLHSTSECNMHDHKQNSLAPHLQVKMTLLLSAVAVPINTVFGVTSAILISRNEFPGKLVVMSMLDLPFSISPVVTGQQCLPSPPLLPACASPLAALCCLCRPTCRTYCLACLLCRICKGHRSAALLGSCAE